LSFFFDFIQWYINFWFLQLWFLSKIAVCIWLQKLHGHTTVTSWIRSYYIVLDNVCEVVYVVCQIIGPMKNAWFKLWIPSMLCILGLISYLKRTWSRPCKYWTKVVYNEWLLSPAITSCSRFEQKLRNSFLL
jgi:hypothetical protein